MSTCPVDRDLQNYLNALDDDDTDAVQARADELLCDITYERTVELLDDVLSETASFDKMVKWFAFEVYFASNKTNGAQLDRSEKYALDLIKPLLLAQAQKEINDEREAAKGHHYGY